MTRSGRPGCGFASKDAFGFEPDLIMQAAIDQTIDAMHASAERH
ncbi:hypothetical protein ACV229_31835 [Burkholderia sp. MR1-5-21]